MKEVRSLAMTAFVLAASGVLAWAGCAQTDLDVGSPPDPVAAPSLPTSAPPDASEPIGNCIDTACAPGFATCATQTGVGSSVLCTVNLMTDNDNCGACGRSCVASGASNTCKDGYCVLACRDSNTDCNGIAEDGCEVDISSDPTHCGSCTTVCPMGAICESSKCVCPPTQSLVGGKCGCLPGQTLCDNACVDLTNDDLNCGSCGKTCDVDRTVGGALVGLNGKKLPPHTHTGCTASVCTKVKCDGVPGAMYSDCNASLPADLAKADPSTGDGCEVDVLNDFDPKNCGACGKACAAGVSCLLDEPTSAIACGCKPSLTQCGTPQDFANHFGFCVDLTTDLAHCGSCGNACGDPNNATMQCDRAECSSSCSMGFADCNGQSSDGCEANILTDPLNCGGCGVQCDVVAGQPCSNGVCATKPCPEVTK